MNQSMETTGSGTRLLILLFNNNNNYIILLLLTIIIKLLLLLLIGQFIQYPKTMARKMLWF